MKAEVEIYKGIEYIQVSSLPRDQKDEILKSLSDRLIIKILKNDTLLKDCIQYQHYDFWYESIFSKIKVQEKQPVTEVVHAIDVATFAFQKS